MLGSTFRHFLIDRLGIGETAAQFMVEVIVQRSESVVGLYFFVEGSLHELWAMTLPSGS